MKGLDISLTTYLLTIIIAFGVAALLKGMDNLLVLFLKWFPHEEHHSDDDASVQADESLAEQAIAIAAAHAKEK